MTVTMASHPQVRGHFKDEPVSDAVSKFPHLHLTCYIGRPSGRPYSMLHVSLGEHHILLQLVWKVSGPQR